MPDRQLGQNTRRRKGPVSADALAPGLIFDPVDRQPDPAVPVRIKMLERQRDPLPVVGVDRAAESILLVDRDDRHREAFELPAVLLDLRLRKQQQDRLRVTVIKLRRSFTGITSVRRLRRVISKTAEVSSRSEKLVRRCGLGASATMIATQSRAMTCCGR